MNCATGRVDRMSALRVKDVAPGNWIEIECAGQFDPGAPRYLITTYQDLVSKVRAFNLTGGQVVYLHPDNICRLVD